MSYLFGLCFSDLSWGHPRYSSSNLNLNFNFSFSLLDFSLRVDQLSPVEGSPFNSKRLKPRIPRITPFPFLPSSLGFLPFCSPYVSLRSFLSLESRTFSTPALKQTLPHYDAGHWSSSPSPLCVRAASFSPLAPFKP